MKSIAKRAEELAELMFPDSLNIWARKNTDKINCTKACIKIADEVKTEMIEDFCSWIDEYFPLRGNGESTFRDIEQVKNCLKNYFK